MMVAPSSVVSPLTSVEPDYSDSSDEEEDRGANIYEQVNNSTDAQLQEQNMIGYFFFFMFSIS